MGLIDDPEAVTKCLAHLTAAEALLEQANDFASLARLALVIDMFRRAHGMDDRAPSDIRVFSEDIV